jgi:hypothetical protein
LVTTAGVVEKISGEWWAPVSEDLNQTPLCNQATDGIFHRSSNSYSIQHGLDDEVRIVEGYGALRAYGECLPTLLKLPPIETIAKPETDAAVVLEVLRVSWDRV